jgi:E3 ubiquitin-protein ligase SIAH1
MEKQDEDFTQKMLFEKVCTCAICENMLMVPVMLVENVGNVCHKCFGSLSEEKGKSLPNTALNAILQGLKFLCQFESEGCDVEVIYGDLKDHEEKCIFRTVECVMPKSDCEWKGKLVDLLKHFKEEHGKHVITSPNDIFSFENTIAKSADVVKLLNNKNKMYILKITEDKDGKSLLHFIFDIKSNPEDEEEELVVKYVGKTDQYKLKVKRMSFNSLHYKHTAKKILLSTLREIAEASENIMVTIKPAKCIFKKMNDEILKQLECPVCKELMRPPIHLCNTGHSLCSSCRQKLDECPTCRQPWSNSRNFCLEAMTLSVQYPCAYSQFGCYETFLGQEIAYHEVICEHKMFTCPVPGCDFTGNYVSTKNHFKLTHKDSLIKTTSYTRTFNFAQYTRNNKRTSHVRVKYFWEYGNIFRLTFTCLPKACKWTVQILNNYDISVKYFYKISITDPQLQDRKITKTNLCLNFPPTVTNISRILAGNHIISFTHHDLSSYKDPDNGKICYCCQIFEKKSN